MFNNPCGVAADGKGNIYVGDAGNNRIQKFDSRGNFLTKWGSDGSAPGEFIASPLGMAMDGPGNLYVADYGNQRIQKFDSSGNFHLQWAVEILLPWP